MKLSIGPILYYWHKNQVLDFYDTMLESGADIIYLGETVCSKRHELRTAEWLELANHIAGHGKEIVLSGLALIEANSELKALEKLCANEKLAVEANDMAAVEMLSENNLPFYCGSSINIYNGYTLEMLYQKGMQRWVMPVELNREGLNDILTYARQQGFAEHLETEVFSYGKLPLAYSARCFSARAHNLPKDDCQYVCMNYPDGVPLATQEDQQLFTVNGIQTQSGHCYDLLHELPTMQAMGVDIVRISPQAEGTEKVVTRFQRAIQGKSDATLLATDSCNGYWYGEPGMQRVPVRNSSDTL